MAGATEIEPPATPTMPTHADSALNQLVSDGLFADRAMICGKRHHQRQARCIQIAAMLAPAIVAPPRIDQKSGISPQTMKDATIAKGNAV